MNLDSSPFFFADDCAGDPFGGSAVSIDGVDGTISFDGVSCEASDFIDGATCLSGVFEIRVTGTVLGILREPIAMLTGEPLRVSGTICSLEPTCTG